MIIEDKRDLRDVLRYLVPVLVFSCNEIGKFGMGLDEMLGLIESYI